MPSYLDVLVQLSTTAISDIPVEACEIYLRSDGAELGSKFTPSENGPLQLPVSPQETIRISHAVGLVVLWPARPCMIRAHGVSRLQLKNYERRYIQGIRFGNGS